MMNKKLLATLVLAGMILCSCSENDKKGSSKQEIGFETTSQANLTTSSTTLSTTKVTSSSSIRSEFTTTTTFDMTTEDTLEEEINSSTESTPHISHSESEELETSSNDNNKQGISRVPDNECIDEDILKGNKRDGKENEDTTNDYVKDEEITESVIHLPFVPAE